MPATLLSVSSAAASSAARLDLRAFPTAGVGLVVSITGTLTATVQVTGDNRTAARWVDHPDLTGLTANALGNVAFPVTGVRLNVTSYTNGTATLDVVQAEGGVR